MDFQGAPDEILIQILHSLGRREALASLSLCSRRTSSLVGPILYSHFQEQNNQDLFLFLRTTLHQPYLASHINAFDGRDERINAEKFILFTPFELDDSARLRAAIQSASANEDEAEKWINAVEGCNWDVVTALVLISLPRLKHLVLGLSGTKASDPSIES